MSFLDLFLLSDVMENFYNWLVQFNLNQVSLYISNQYASWLIMTPVA